MLPVDNDSMINLYDLKSLISPTQLAMLGEIKKARLPKAGRRHFKQFCKTKIGPGLQREAAAACWPPVLR
jgi:hypothetical protein